MGSLFGFIPVVKRQKKKLLSTKWGSIMKSEYDFSKGERGKFYRPRIKINFPVYLDDESVAFVEKIARKKKKDLSTIVNDLIHSDKRMMELFQ